MANIDYDLAKKEIEQKFKDSHRRTIVFWFDEPRNFLPI